MIEGSGSIPLTNGSGSGRPKNMDPEHLMGHLNTARQWPGETWVWLGYWWRWAAWASPAGTPSHPPAAQYSAVPVRTAGKLHRSWAYEREELSQAGLRIRIRIGSGFDRVSGSGSGIRIWIRIQQCKNDPQKYKKFRFHLWSAGCSLLRAEASSVTFWRPRDR